jgi:hypothetical protein
MHLELCVPLDVAGLWFSASRHPRWFDEGQVGCQNQHFHISIFSEKTCREAVIESTNLLNVFLS